jgi:hypothetical protein
MDEAVAAVRTNTLQTEYPDTLLLPPTRYSQIATKRIPDTQVTVLQFFLANNPWIKNVDEWYHLETAGSGSTKRMVVYRRDPMKVRLAIPQEFEVFPVEQRGLEFLVPTHSRIGGVIMPKPKSAVFRDGL